MKEEKAKTGKHLKREKAYEAKITAKLRKEEEHENTKRINPDPQRRG